MQCPFQPPEYKVLCIVKSISFLVKGHQARSTLDRKGGSGDDGERGRRSGDAGAGTQERGRRSGDAGAGTQERGRRSGDAGAGTDGGQGTDGKLPSLRNFQSSRVQVNLVRRIPENLPSVPGFPRFRSPVSEGAAQKRE